MFVASFFDTSIVKNGLGSFIGLENYTTLVQSSEFWSSMWHTLQFTLYTVPPLVVLSFVFAVLANRMRRGHLFWRMAFFTPFILPSAAISLIWVFIYTADTGLWAQIQKWVGVDAPTPVLATPSIAMVGIAVTTIWWTIGFNFILYLAGLQDIPRELYEAAAIDGATPWQQIRHLTIPLLSRTTTLVLLLQIIASLKIFDQVYLMTSGGPGTSTETALVFITKTGFTDYRIGAAAAASFVLFLVILVIALVRQVVERAQLKGA
jgi:multiple sugar transport system permease protein